MSTAITAVSATVNPRAAARVALARAAAVALCLAFAVAPAFAQAPPTAALMPSPQPAPSASNNVQAGTAGDYRSSTSEGMTDRLFNVNSDSVDFENGSFQWKNRTFSLGNSRAMRARLEKYLATPAPASAEGQRYEQLLRRIEDLLSPKRITPQNYARNVQTAWELLDQAATFDGDGGNCTIISTLVHKTARMRRELEALSKERDIQYWRKNEALNYSTSHERRRELERDGALGGGIQSTMSKGKTTTRSAAAPTEGTAESARRKELLAEKRGELAKTDSQMSVGSLKARLEFQSQIVSFLVQRRFHHAIIATSFYRQIFPGGNQELRVGQKQVKEMFPISEFVPTIESVESVAREAINEVENGMKAVSTLYDGGERFGAFERIQETFFLGEYEPAVIYFDSEKKRVLREIWATARELQNSGDERDLAACEAGVKKLRAVADDFPVARINGKIAAARRASDLEILAAEEAVLAKNTEGVKAHLSNAAKIWPANPALNEFSRRVRERANLLAQMVPEFDRLLAEGSHRNIYNRKQEFAVALMTDEVRARKFKDLVERLGKIDAFLFQAQTFHRQRNTYPAWDLVLEAAKVEANDPEVARARSELAPAAAAYTLLLNQSEANEKEGNYAVALNAMLAAQELNQSSEHCRLAIQRLSHALMETM